MYEFLGFYDFNKRYNDRVSTPRTPTKVAWYIGYCNYNTFLKIMALTNYSLLLNTMVGIECNYIWLHELPSFISWPTFFTMPHVPHLIFLICEYFWKILRLPSANLIILISCLQIQWSCDYQCFFIIYAGEFPLLWSV